MKILRLELFGFKSFKDRTIITFDQAVTAIVGSNGCGKSNVIDALYWVMGDMSPKHLRGSSMSDVIFSGSRDSAPMDMAEVTMVLERDPEKDSELPPQFQASNEIQITRRYYRNGESEYFINRVSCRLRDIQEFFMDTGVGAKAYSIVEQGAISRMVSMKAEDRRVVIEEVAGIMKFKARKAETERKIDNSKQNLQRVDDIVTDLQKQLTSLKRQADKAEKFRALSDQLKSLELRLATREWVDRSTEKTSHILEVTNLKLRLEELTEKNSVGKVKLDEAVEQLATRENEYNERREDTRRHELTLKDLDAQNSTFGARRESFQHRLENNRHSIQEIGTRALEVESELETVTASLTELDDRARDVARSLDLAEEESQTLAERVEELRELVNTARRELHAEEILQTRLTQQIQGFQRTLSQLEGRKKNLGEQLENLGSDIDLREAERQATLDSLEKAFATRSELEGAKDTVDEELSQLDDQKTQVQAARDTLRHDLARVQIRREQLESLERDLSGVDDAAKALALHMREQGQEQNLLADIVKVPPLLERAVEAVLGRNLQRVVATDLASAEELRLVLELADDRKAQQGRAPLWIPTLPAATDAAYVAGLDMPFRPRRTEDASVPGASDDSIDLGEPVTASQIEAAVLAQNFGENSEDSPELASGQVYGEEPGPDGMVGVVRAQEATPALPTLRDYLLQNDQVVGPLDLLVAPDDDSAPQAWQGLVRGFWVTRTREALMQLGQELSETLGHLPINLVSLDGDVLLQNGFLDLAPIEVSDEQSTGLIQRKRVISDLRTQQEHFETELRATESELERVQQALASAKERFRELTSQLAKLNPDVERYSTFLRQVESQIARLAEKKNLLGQDLERAQSESEEISQRLEEVAAQLQEGEAKKGAIADRLHESESELNSSLGLHAERNRALNDLRGESRRLDRETSDVQSRRAALEQEGSLQQARKHQLQEEISRVETQLVELEGQIEELSVQRSARQMELNQSRDLEEEVAQAVNAFKAQSKDLQAELDRLTHDLQNVSNRARDIEQSVAIHDVELRNISEKIEQQYQVALATLDEAQLREMSSPGDLEEIMDGEAAKKHAQQLRSKIENLGRINMVAVDEFEDIRRRHEYLFIQRQDLAEGLSQLKDAIDRIDRESRDRFRDAFNAVNEAFTKTFPILFGGGNAELRLTVPDNMLETGIEIVAQPPGKKLQNITLLSGGEKALTAVSLIFGIFSIKPSPFCVLDEVDAPLDDANVGRFNSLIRRITGTSQFIIITHHKQTMESCDALFGVTMEKPGISKVASVRLAEMPAELV